MCFFWGTTYLGIRIALDSFSPALLVCLRNLISGTITLSVAAMIGAHFPRGRDLWITAGYGLMVIGVGNGTLAVVEQWIPTGLASLFVTTSPFWFVGIDALLAGGEKLHAPTIRGLLVGFAGVFLLVAPAAWTALTQHTFASGGAVVLGFVLLQLSGASWALGSLLQRNRRSRAHPFVLGGVQQLSTGLALLVPSIFQLPSAHWTVRGMGAIVYLAIFGGIVGYGCYALAHQPAAAGDRIDLHLYQSGGGGLLGLVGLSGTVRPARSGRHGGHFRGRGDGAAGGFSAGSESSRRPRRRERLAACRTGKYPAAPAPDRTESAGDRYAS